MYPNFSNLWKNFLLHPNLNENVPIFPNFIEIVKCTQMIRNLSQYE